MAIHMGLSKRNIFLCVHCHPTLKSTYGCGILKNPQKINHAEHLGWHVVVEAVDWAVTEHYR